MALRLLHVNNVEALLISINREVKRHPAWDVMWVKRRKSMTPNIDWREGKYTPWRVSSLLLLLLGLE